MVKIEKICENISDYISRELNFNEDKKSIINYGIFAFIHMMICILLVIIVGFIFNVMVEALIISFTTSILRKSSGGVHANSPEKCAVIGTISSVGLALIVKNCNLNYIMNIFIGSIIFMFSYYIIYKLAPVDSVSKPIKNIKKIRKLKRASIITTSIYLGISIVDIVLYFLVEEHVFLTYSMCIYMGLLWQVFSLTQNGHRILGKLNTI